MSRRAAEEAVPDADYWWEDRAFSFDQMGRLMAWLACERHGLWLYVQGVRHQCGECVAHAERIALTGGLR